MLEYFSKQHEKPFSCTEDIKNSSKFLLLLTCDFFMIFNKYLSVQTDKLDCKNCYYLKILKCTF